MLNNLDQLKTLILIKGEEKRVGRFLPSFISLTLTFPIYFSPVYPIVPPNLPTTIMNKGIVALMYGINSGLL